MKLLQSPQWPQTEVPLVAGSAALGFALTMKIGDACDSATVFAMDAGLGLAGGVPFKGGGFLLLAARAKKMREYQGRYLQANPLGLIDGASVYGYAA